MDHFATIFLVVLGIANLATAAYELAKLSKPRKGGRRPYTVGDVITSTTIGLLVITLALVYGA